MADTSQRRAVKNYQKCLVERGLARFERLAENGPEADQLLAAVNQAVADELPQKGGIPKALRRSPLVGAIAIFARSFEPGRKVDLLTSSSA
jgi:hypothetical protein